GEATTPQTRGPGPAQPGPPPAKKVKISLPPPAPAKASAPAKAVAAPPPTLKQRPPPLEAPTVSRSAPTAPAKRPPKRQGKHTVHGTTRRGIIISPPTDIDFRAEVFTSESFNALNHCLKDNLKVDDLLITAAHQLVPRILFETNRVPTIRESDFVLKVLREDLEIKKLSRHQATSISYLKLIDVPITNPTSKDWLKPTHDLIISSLRSF